MKKAPGKKRSLWRARRGGHRHRRGTAAVECAVCIPLLLAIMFSTLEVCSGIFLRETATVAAYEGCRVGVRRRATNRDARDQVQAVLDARNVTGGTITVTPADFSTLSALDPITVTVTAPTAGNSLYIFDFLAGRTVTGQVSMVREFNE